MNKQLKLYAVLVVIICLLSALLGWICGFNFDHRDGVVGLWAGLTLFFCITLAPPIFLT